MEPEPVGGPWGVQRNHHMVTRLEHGFRQQGVWRIHLFVARDKP